MINLIITVVGGLLVLLGFWLMSFGFYTPPNLPFFFLGLLLSVFGAIIIIFFGSKINSKDVKFTPKKSAPKAKESRIIPKEMPKEITPKPSKRMETPKEPKNIKNLVTEEKPKAIKKIEEPKRTPKKIVPVKTSGKEIERSKPIVTKEQSELKTKEEPPKESVFRRIMPKRKQTDAKSPEKVEETLPQKEKIGKPPIEAKKVVPVKSDTKTEDEYVKNRLDRLKENYMQNTKDLENLIEERLDSFKGTLNQIKSESTDPSIIWSFDAGDVQETLKETILKAESKVLMMYPWVRNIDVGVLKRFMETESKMIIQEASLDDDASVELIKLLMDNNVKIRTMPHVHTVAVVSDKDNGLIISTDPIYESFEVGVVYKDQKSIEEIERMFEEAWKLSQDINLEINQ